MMVFAKTFSYLEQQNGGGGAFWRGVFKNAITWV